MTNFATLAAGIASQLDGEYTPSANAHDNNVLASITLRNEREGLKVILRRGHGVESNRITATMSVTDALRDHARYQRDFYNLRTAAAMSRDARAIAAQIETKILPPAMEMLASIKDAAAREKATVEALAVEVEKLRTQKIPGLRVEDPKPGSYSAHVWVDLGESGYITGEINSDGGLYVSRANLSAEHFAAVLQVIGGGSGK